MDGVEQDAGGHGQIEGGDPTAHGQTHEVIGGRDLLGRQPLPLAAQQQDKRQGVSSRPIVAAAAGRCGDELPPPRPRPAQEVGKRGGHDRPVEDDAHAGPHHRRVQRVHPAIEQQQPRRANSIDGAQDGADIARVLWGDECHAPGKATRV